MSVPLSQNNSTELGKQLLMTFLARMFEEAKISPTTEELRETMMKETLQRLQHHLLLDLLGALPENRMEDFKKIAEEKPDQEKIMNFLKEAIPNSDEIIGESLLEFKNTFLNAPALAD